jgi:eukaryotic-like serine/threonine-protein kinase
MTVAPDRSLERYEIVERIAAGGMAEVFRAKAYGAHGFEKTLAIKRILPDFAEDPEFEQRFIREAKLAVQLAHANIVQVFDFGRFGGELFIAMEYVDGLDLAALMRLLRQRGAQVSLGAALHIAIELAKGLDYAHKRGVVHRDVSPSNLLLSRSGEVKIADFGIAHAQVDSNSDEGRRIMGKWRYMSPEQARGQEITAQSDLFSAGAVIHEVLTGQKLFPGDDAGQVLENIEHMVIPAVSSLREGVPDRVDEVIGSVLQRRRDDRPQRAAEVQRALTEISYEHGLVASALDVAEVVSSVLGEVTAEAVTASGGGRGLDELIRQQIGQSAGAAPVVDPVLHNDLDRHTEEVSQWQTQATFVRKGVDEDGSTMWEVDQETVAAVPSAIRGERSTRSSSAVTATAPARAGIAGHRRALLVLVAAGAVVLASGVLWGMLASGEQQEHAVASHPDAVPIASAPIDAGPRSGKFTIESVPPQARVFVDGVQQASLTPVTVEVEPEVPHTVRWEHDGYQPEVWEAVRVGAGKNVMIRGTLQREFAGLRVTTKPPGARVVLDGTYLGDTPLERTDLRPGSERTLVLEKPNFRSVSEPLTLAHGQIATISRTLRSDVTYGTIDIVIAGSWADVYFGGRRIGRASDRGFRLPVGTHRLRLKNPESGRETTVVVTVYADRTERYRFEL